MLREAVWRCHGPERGLPGRSLTDLLSISQELHSAGVDLYLHRQALNTRTPAGKAMFQMMGVFADFERSMIQKRVKAGMARAKAQGARFRRPGIGAEKEKTIKELLKQGVGLISVAKQVGCGVSAVQRVQGELVQTGRLKAELRRPRTSKR